MPPKQQRIVVQRAGGPGPQSKGFLSSTYSTLTSSENASVVRSILAFGVSFYPPPSPWPLSPIWMNQSKTIGFRALTDAIYRLPLLSSRAPGPNSSFLRMPHLSRNNQPVPGSYRLANESIGNKSSREKKALISCVASIKYDLYDRNCIKLDESPSDEMAGSHIRIRSRYC